MSLIKRVALGSQGLQVPVEGLGCMGMTGFGEGSIYGQADETESIATIHRALELGVNLLDATGVIVLMLCASIFHIASGEASQIGVNIVFAAMAAFIAWGRFTKASITQPESKLS